jgi:hypothetical protein
MASAPRRVRWLQSPGWSRAWRAALLVGVMGACPPFGAAYGQVRGVPMPGGATGPAPTVLPGPPGLGPSGLVPQGPSGLVPRGPSGLVPQGPLGLAPHIRSPDGVPAARAAAGRDGEQAPSRASDSPPAAVRDDGHKSARAQLAHRERMRVANAVKAIGEQNRQRAAIVQKTQQVVP